MLNKTFSPHLFEWVDLTHDISENIPTWSGSCGFKLIDILKYEECDTDCQFLVQHIETVAGIGTHMDAPAHCFPNGKTIDQIALRALISPCIVIDVSQEAHENYFVEMETLERFEKQYGNIWKNAFVIFRTGWERYWTEPEKYRNDYRFPSISKEVAQYLLIEDIVGIGIDTLSPDRPESGYPVHHILLGAGKYIIENIANAHLLPAVGSHIFVMPLKLAKGTEAPVRLIGMLPVPPNAHAF